MSVFYLAAAIFLEVCGTTALKLFDGLSRLGPASVVVVCYTASFAVLSLVLRGIDLATAYAV
jgi:small multidrug resistance pump